MGSRTIGIVLLVVGGGVGLWLAVELAGGREPGPIALGFVLFSLPFLAVGLYFVLTGRGEERTRARLEKERNVLNAVETRGRVSVADLALENDADREEIRRYIYDLIGKDLFRGYVNWDKGELVSAQAAEIQDDTCPNCGGKVELAGKGLVRCPYCGTETYLSPPGRQAAPGR